MIKGRAATARWWLLAVIVVVLGCRKGDPDSNAVPEPTRVDVRERAAASTTPRLELVELRSDRLSTFAEREVKLRAIVLTPPHFDPDDGLPALYFVHGFGGTPERLGAIQWRRIAKAQGADKERLLRVFLDGSHPQGHHVFADSATMGPWGTALVTELLPAIEHRYGTVAAAGGRFITGHSSGGWASLWVQISHPETFGGVWSTAPDPVDFRDFVGVDIYTFENMYRTPVGKTVQLEWKAGKPTKSLREFVEWELETSHGAGQFHSFDAVFSPRGPEGEPLRLFDRASGEIDRDVAKAWADWDISRLLRTEWKTRQAGLSGKLHVIVGTEDTYGLHRSARLMADALQGVGSDAEFVFVAGRDHSDLYAPHDQHYPRGLLAHIEGQATAQHRSR